MSEGCLGVTWECQVKAVEWHVKEIIWPGRNCFIYSFVWKPQPCQGAGKMGEPWGRKAPLLTVDSSRVLMFKGILIFSGSSSLLLYPQKYPSLPLNLGALFDENELD